MADTPGTRRLQAIMFTDIVGFSAMMGSNEQSTVALVLEHRELVRAALAKHDGVEHETIGDAFLVLFDSPVNALRCAIDIQQQFKAQNAERPSAQQVWLRIGLHLADILHREGGIYGDGVNAAARIQGTAEPGGVVLSEPMRMHTAGKVKVELRPMGVRELKGIAEAPALYALQLDTERGVAGTEKLTRSARAGRQLTYAAVALVLAVGAAFAINSAVTKASEAKRAAAPAPAPAVDDAAQGGDREPAAAAAASAAEGEPNAEAAQLEAAARAEAAAAEAKRTLERVEAMSEVMHKAAVDKVKEALASRGQERVSRLEQALALDPDNAAIAALLTQARVDARHELAASEAKRAAKAAAEAKEPTAKATTKAPTTGDGRPAGAPAPAIRPRIVED